MLSASFYGFSHEGEWKTDVTVSAKDGYGNVIGSVTVADAPFARNRTSEFSGSLFTGGGTMDVSIDGEWLDPHAVTW